MATKTFTFTGPPASVSDLVATPQAGGSLVPGVTYYYVIVPANKKEMQASDFIHGGISNEVLFTADATNKSVKLDWTSPSGANAYMVFRTTTSGSYANWNIRLGGPAGYTSHYYTTLIAATNTFTDDGTRGLNHSGCNAVRPATNLLPQGLDCRTYGQGDLLIEGGDAADPIIPVDIYNAAVAGGWANYCKWDAGELAVMGNFRISNNKTVMSFKRITHTTFGGCNLVSSHADSVLTFGTKVSGSNITKDGVKFQSLMNEQNFTMGNHAFLYDCDFAGMTDVNSPYYLPSIASFYVYFQLAIGAVFVNCTAQSMSFFTITGNVPINGFRMDGNFYPAVVDCAFIENVISNRHFINYTTTRVDTPIFLSETYQIDKRPVTPGIITRHIDGAYPNSTDYTDKLPRVRWGIAGDYDSYFELWHSIRMKVVDANNNGISGANVIIKDKDMAVAVDYDGTEISFTTDATGMVWREPISITSATSTTLTDSSKAWTVNQWAGRNIWIASGNGRFQQRKVLSNTATTITVTEAFAITPAAGDQAGVMIEIKRAKLTHKAGTGVGDGDAYTTKDVRTPHTLTVTKAGYQDYQDVIAVDRKLDLEVALLAPAGGGSPLNMGLVPLGIKQVIA